MRLRSRTRRLSYARASVDIAAGERAVELIRAAVARTTRPEVVGGIGGFAGLFDASKLTSYRRPLLVTATDGVGTKVVIAQQLGVYDTVGIDLVGMGVDDAWSAGPSRCFFPTTWCRTDPSQRVDEIVGGVAEGCVLANCALLGGETAIIPATWARAISTWRAPRPAWSRRTGCSGRTGSGRATRSSRWPRPACTRTGFRWSGRVLSRAGGPLDLGAAPPGLDRTLGEELLVPTRIYARDCLALAEGCDVHAFAHVTGGGLALNLARVLPQQADAVLDRATWSPQPIFGLLAEQGSVAGEEMERVFNMGVGMVAVVGAHDADAALSLLASGGYPHG